MSYLTDLSDTQYDVGKWAEKTFTKSTNQTIITHLRREVTELQEAINNAEPRAILEECSDVAMLLLHLCHKNHIDLQSGIRDKFEICRARVWGEPDAEGVIEHIRTEATP
jgi:NTP pyrophosphatase (non-canonical NTP hydrolase)